MQDDIAQSDPKRGRRGLRVKIKIDYVLVFLRRVFRIADRAVGALLEPAGMLLQPGMIKGALDCEIKRNLQPLRGCRGDEAAKILGRSESGMNAIMPPVRAAD